MHCNDEDNNINNVSKRGDETDTPCLNQDMFLFHNVNIQE